MLCVYILFWDNHYFSNRFYCTSSLCHWIIQVVINKYQIIYRTACNTHHLANFKRPRKDYEFVKFFYLTAWQIHRDAPTNWCVDTDKSTLWPIDHISITNVHRQMYQQEMKSPTWAKFIATCPKASVLTLRIHKPSIINYHIVFYWTKNKMVNIVQK